MNYLIWHKIKTLAGGNFSLKLFCNNQYFKKSTMIFTISWKKTIKSLLLSKLNYYNVPEDRERKLNVHKTFRRRPRRLLNVLFTFSLRSVSTWVVIPNQKTRAVAHFLSNSSHCVKSVQIRSFFWSVFSVFSPNVRKCWPEKTSYLDTFHAVSRWIQINIAKLAFWSQYYVDSPIH